MTEPRRHHFLPQFYLRGFTSDGAPDGALHLLRPNDGHEWRGTPGSVGHQRDFYRVDGVDGVDPNQLERNFATVEGQVAAVLADVIDREALPTSDEDFGLLLVFVAMMATRVPMHREMLERPMKESLGKMAHIVAHSVPLPSDQEARDYLRQVIEEERLVVELSQEFLIEMMLHSIQVISPLLNRRVWTLLISDSRAEFVTADAPVALSWSDGRDRGFFPPGFGLVGTDVTLPLSRRLALLGTFEGLERTLSVDVRVVASINTRTGRQSGRFICWSGRADSFVWLDPEGQIGTYEALVTRFRERQARPGEKD